MRLSHFGWATFVILCVGLGHANGGTIIAVSGGSGDPAATLGGFTMTPFAADLRANGGLVSSVPSPLSGSVLFSSPVGHISSVANWGDPWNNSYTGDVYHNISASSLTLTLPAGTAAFYLFIQPNAFSLAEAITVTAQDGTSSTQTVQTNLDGSKYYGFYGTGGTNLTSLTISEPIHSNDFAIGQFAIAAASTNATPEPTTITLFGMGTLGMIGFGCRRKLVII